MIYYPLSLNIEGLKCVVAGGGSVAMRKVARLHAAGAEVVVVSPTVDETFDSIKDIEHRPRPFEEGDIDGAFLVCAATGDAKVNEHIAKACAARDVLCNVADAPGLGRAILPAVFERGPLQITVSTGGQSPAFAAALVEKLGGELPPQLEEYLAFVHEARLMARQSIENGGERMALARYLGSWDGYRRYVDTPVEARQDWLDGLVHATGGDPCER